MIELSNVTKRFGETQALSEIDLSVPAHETTVLIGPSGCGKSTLLRLIIGLIGADEGMVRFDGETVVPDGARPLRRRMGYVIQEGGLFPHLTCRRNVTLMARHVGWNASDLDRRVGELRELVHLDEDVLAGYPAQRSGGQRQRVSLMRALMLDPDVLLLDEPLGALDPMIRAGLQDDLRGIFRRLDKTVVLVTHDVGEAGFFGDRVALLRDGEIEQIGSFEDLVHTPTSDFAREFVNAQRSPLAEA